MTMNDCIKCGILTNEIKILINCIYKLKSKYNKNCVECCEWASKGKDELAEIIKNESLEEHRKDYISAAIHKKDYHFEKCKIEGRENIPINEIGPMKGTLIGIYLNESIGDFSWFLNHVKDKHQDKYKEIIDIQCFEENKNFMIEFPIVLVTPPDRGGIKYLSNGVKYYVEDGNHRLLKWIDLGKKTVPAAFVIIDKQHTSGYADNWPNPLPNVRLI